MVQATIRTVLVRFLFCLRFLEINILSSFLETSLKIAMQQIRICYTYTFRIVCYINLPHANRMKTVVEKNIPKSETGIAFEASAVNVSIGNCWHYRSVVLDIQKVCESAIGAPVNNYFD